MSLRFTLPGISQPRRRENDPVETRQRMIDHTNRFLSRALRRKKPLPRIPCIQVAKGGYHWVQTTPGARAMADRFWERLLGD